jgi:hypothetical protein
MCQSSRFTAVEKRDVPDLRLGVDRWDIHRAVVGLLWVGQRGIPNQRKTDKPTPSALKRWTSVAC